MPPQQTVPPALRKLRQAALVQQTRLLLVLRRVLAQLFPVTAQTRARKLETPQTLLAQQTLSQLPLRAVLDAQSVLLPPFLPSGLSPHALLPQPAPSFSLPLQPALSRTL